MAAYTPFFANETNAARLLDMKPAEFRDLVDRGILPPGIEIAPGFKRWSCDQLKGIARGVAARPDGGLEL